MVSQETINLLRDGCRDTFSSLYNEYWHKMFLIAYRKLGDKEVAEEIVQDIFTRLWRDREELEVANLENYLFSSVRFEVIDHIRRNIRREAFQKYVSYFGTYSDLSTEGTVYFNDLLSSVNKVAATLPERTREIFHYRKIESWPVARIARKFRISEKTVEYHLQRATQILRHSLQDHMLLLFLISWYFLKIFP